MQQQYNASLTTFNLSTKKNIDIKRAHLNQIIQVTQQNETAQVQTSAQETDTNKNQTCCTRICNYFQRLILYINNKQKLAEVKVNQSQVSILIEKIRNKESGYTIVLPPQKQAKKTLVLDLDETMIFASFRKLHHYDFQIEFPLKKNKIKAYVVKRFGLDAFLHELSQIYEIVVFTAARRKYADQILDKIDQKGWISHRLYRQHCIVVNKLYYLKNLKILGRNLQTVIMVDDNRMGGILQPDNYYRIDPFIGNLKDRKLVRLASFLKQIDKFQDVRKIYNFRKRFQEKQITLKENNQNQITHEEKKKMYRNRPKTDRNSQTLPLAQRDQNVLTQPSQYCQQSNVKILAIR